MKSSLIDQFRDLEGEAKGFQGAVDSARLLLSSDAMAPALLARLLRTLATEIEDEIRRGSGTGERYLRFVDEMLRQDREIDRDRRQAKADANELDLLGELYCTLEETLNEIAATQTEDEDAEPWWEYRPDRW